MDDSLILARNEGVTPGGNIDVHVDGSLSLQNDAEIFTLARNAGAAGDLAVHAGALAIDGAANLDFLTGIFSFARAGSGDAGNVRVRVDHPLTISGSGLIASNTFTAGSGGNVVVQAETVRIDATAAPRYFTGISSNTYGAGNGGNVSVAAGAITILGSEPNGNLVSGIVAEGLASGTAGAAGNVSVAVAGQLTLMGGGEISAITFDSGNAGNVTVTAQDILISGNTPRGRFSSGIFTQNNLNGSPGTAGSLSVTAAGSLTLTQGGEISSTTNALGSAGDIVVNARAITITGRSSFPQQYSSGIIAQTQFPGESGNAGNVTVNAAGPLIMTGGGEISSSTFGLGDAGNVTVNAGAITIVGAPSEINNQGRGNSAIIAQSLSFQEGGAAGNVTVHAAGPLKISAGGEISSTTLGGGDGGSVTVKAQTVTISGVRADHVNASTISAQSRSGGVGGAAGNVSVIASGAVKLLSGGAISSSTSGYGRGGSVTVKAQAVTVSGVSPDSFYASAISARSESSDFFGGAAGNVSVFASGDVNLLGGGEISSSTSGFGKGGSVTVKAQGVTISGVSPDGLSTSAITAQSESSYFGGAAGDVSVIATGDVKLLAGGEISSSTNGSGKGGSVSVNGRDVTISGVSADGLSASAISAQSESSGFGGAAGNVTVTAAGEVSLLGGGEISSSTNGAGRGGSVTVNAQDVTIAGASGSGEFRSGIGADTHGSGNAGNVTVSAANQLTVSDGGSITAQTTGAGNGGDVTAAANRFDLANGGVISAQASSSAFAGSVRVSAGTLNLTVGAAILSANTGQGNAGDVMISASRSVTLDGRSTISTAAAVGQAGGILLATGEDLRLVHGSAITASAGLGGGNITLQVQGDLFFTESSLTATAGTGAGGNITIDPNFLILDHALISANAAAGAGGDILISGNYFFDSESPITATGSTAGTVSIAAPELDLANALHQLTAALIDASSQLREQCARRMQQDFSSFLVLGQGGISEAPEGPMPGTESQQRRR